MMKIKKILMFMLTIAFSISLLVGCGAKENDTDGKSDTDSSEATSEEATQDWEVKMFQKKLT